MVLIVLEKIKLKKLSVLVAVKVYEALSLLLGSLIGTEHKK